MKHSLLWLPFLMLGLITSSCYTPRATQTQRLSSPEEPIKEILLLYGDIQEDIHNLDKETYEKSLNGKYNDLENKHFRESLYKHLFPLTNPTLLFNTDSLFEDFRQYPYGEFKKRLDEKSIRYILLVTQKEKLALAENIIRKYQVYLLDADSGKPLWVSYGYGSGTVSKGKRLAKGIKKDLDAENGILLSSAPVKFS